MHEIKRDRADRRTVRVRRIEMDDAAMTATFGAQHIVRSLIVLISEGFDDDARALLLELSARPQRDIVTTPRKNRDPFTIHPARAQTHLVAASNATIDCDDERTWARRTVQIQLPISAPKLDLSLPLPKPSPLFTAWIDAYRGALRAPDPRDTSPSFKQSIAFVIANIADARARDDARVAAALERVRVAERKQERARQQLAIAEATAQRLTREIADVRRVIQRAGARITELETRLEECGAPDRCVVCLTASANVVNLPCGHICACVACEQAMRACASFGRVQCATCRAPVVQAQRVFFAGAPK